jgi:hypothetical protein
MSEDVKVPPKPPEPPREITCSGGLTLPPRGARDGE